MRFLSGVLSRPQSDAYVERAEEHLAANGYCKWAVEAPGVGPFIGAVGLTRVKFDASFTPAVEVAWRLKSSILGGHGLCHRGSPGLDRGWLQPGGLERDRSNDRARQRRFAAGHGAVGHDPFARVRPSALFSRQPNAPARFVSLATADAYSTYTLELTERGWPPKCQPTCARRIKPARPTMAGPTKADPVSHRLAERLRGEARGRGAVRPLLARALFHGRLALPDRAGGRGDPARPTTTCARRSRSRARRACPCCRAAAAPRSRARPSAGRW